MNTLSCTHYNASGKRSRSKVTSASEDETSNSMKRMKPDCVALTDLNKSRIYNFGYRKKPAELFRKDLISAMKMPDSEQLNREDYLLISEHWREEWEKGVQVPVHPDHLPMSNVRVLRPTKSDGHFKLPKKLISSETEIEQLQSNYELDLMDLCWLECINKSNLSVKINDSQLEDVINELEHQCAKNMKDKRVGIEYDDHIICDVCRSPDGEEGNEMVFCDVCNICVHQACYGIAEIPEGDWLCVPCKELGSQKNVSCVLCPNSGGALKPTNNPDEWAHVSCALWVPEVSIGCVAAMEPITKIKQIPQTRWTLVCAICNIKKGAPIQCSVKTCKVAYHVTCAFKHKLKMKAIVEEEGNKGVKLKSYCTRHSEKDVDDDGKAIEAKTESGGSNQPKHHEIEIATSYPDKSSDDVNNEFWKYVDINRIQHEIQRRHHLDDDKSHVKLHQIIDLILQYWKLKRTSNYGASLIKLPTSAQFEEQQQQHRKEIMRLRVDLERIRNLSYMICRREKVKRNWMNAHQASVETALKLLTGSDSANEDETDYKLFYVTKENEKLVSDIVSTSVIYDYHEKEDKNRTNAIIKTLKKLSRVERLRNLRNKPNPYAKFYMTQLTRKEQKEQEDREAHAAVLQQKLNGLTCRSASTSPNKPINGITKKNVNNKPINGLSSPLISYKGNVPLNGIHSNSNSTSSCDVDLNASLTHHSKSPTNTSTYRQSPRSLLKPKLSNSNSNSPLHVISSLTLTNQKQTTPTTSPRLSHPCTPSSPTQKPPIITRSSLVGYKIPKKAKHEQMIQTNTDSKKEVQEVIQSLKRKPLVDPEMYTRVRSPSRSPSKVSQECEQNNKCESPSFRTNRINYYHKPHKKVEQQHQQTECYVSKNKNDKRYFARKPQSILSHVTRRNLHGFNDSALTATHDIDMRSNSFRPPVIH